MPIMHNVDSRNVDSVGYEHGDLYVEFKRTHATYVYYCVPKAIYDDLLTVTHPGQYFDEYVKKAGYKYDRL